MIELKVPSAGESITEVTIVEWLKEEGATAEPDETVAVIETDKANVELVAPAKGRITRILKSAGESAAVGEVIGYMDADGAAAPAPERTIDMRAPQARKEPPKKEPPKKEPPPSENGGRLMAAPSVRRAMREQEIDPKSVKGSGPGGRILMDDLEAKEEAEASEEVETKKE